MTKDDRIAWWLETIYVLSFFVQLSAMIAGAVVCLICPASRSVWVGAAISVSAVGVVGWGLQWRLKRWFRRRFPIE